MINPILTGVSAAAHALEALFAATPGGSASSSAGAFSTGQGLPGGGAASPQAAPSHASNRFAPAALGFLTALQDPESAAAGFLHGAETAIGQDIKGIGSVLERLKDALTGAPGAGSAAPSALAVGSAAAGALNQLSSGLAGLFEGHHHHRHGGAGLAGGAGSTASSAASVLSLSPGGPGATT